MNIHTIVGNNYCVYILLLIIFVSSLVLLICIRTIKSRGTAYYLTLANGQRLKYYRTYDSISSLIYKIRSYIDYSNIIRLYLDYMRSYPMDSHATRGVLVDILDSEINTIGIIERAKYDAHNACKSIELVNNPIYTITLVQYGCRYTALIGTEGPSEIHYKALVYNHRLTVARRIVAFGNAINNNASFVKAKAWRDFDYAIMGNLYYTSVIYSNGHGYSFVNKPILARRASRNNGGVSASLVLDGSTLPLYQSAMTVGNICRFDAASKGVLSTLLAFVCVDINADCRRLIIDNCTNDTKHITLRLAIEIDNLELVDNNNIIIHSKDAISKYGISRSKVLLDTYMCGVCGLDREFASVYGRSNGLYVAIGVSSYTNIALVGGAIEIETVLDIAPNSQCIVDCYISLHSDYNKLVMLQKKIDRQFLDRQLSICYELDYHDVDRELVAKSMPIVHNSIQQNILTDKSIFAFGDKYCIGHTRYGDRYITQCSGLDTVSENIIISCNNNTVCDLADAGYSLASGDNAWYHGYVYTYSSGAMCNSVETPNVKASIYTTIDNGSKLYIIECTSYMQYRARLDVAIKLQLFWEYCIGTLHSLVLSREDDTIRVLDGDNNIFWIKCSAELEAAPLDRYCPNLCASASIYIQPMETKRVVFAMSFDNSISMESLRVLATDGIHYKPCQTVLGDMYGYTLPIAIMQDSIGMRDMINNIPYNILSRVVDNIVNANRRINVLMEDCLALINIHDSKSYTYIMAISACQSTNGVFATLGQSSWQSKQYAERSIQQIFGYRIAKDVNIYSILYVLLVVEYIDKFGRSILDMHATYCDNIDSDSNSVLHHCINALFAAFDSYHTLTIDNMHSRDASLIDSAMCALGLFCIVTPRFCQFVPSTYYKDRLSDMVDACRQQIDGLWNKEWYGSSKQAIVVQAIAIMVGDNEYKNTLAINTALDKVDNADIFDCSLLMYALYSTANIDKADRLAQIIFARDDIIDNRTGAILYKCIVEHMVGIRHYGSSIKIIPTSRAISIVAKCNINTVGFDVDINNHNRGRYWLMSIDGIVHNKPIVQLSQWIHNKSISLNRQDVEYG